MRRRRQQDPKDFLLLRVVPDGEYWGVTRGPYQLLFFTREAAIDFAINDIRSTPLAEVHVKDADRLLQPIHPKRECEGAAP